MLWGAVQPQCKSSCICALAVEVESSLLLSDSQEALLPLTSEGWGLIEAPTGLWWWSKHIAYITVAVAAGGLIPTFRRVLEAEGCNEWWASVSPPG